MVRTQRRSAGFLCAAGRACALAVVLALGLPGAARAHPEVDRGHRLLAQAEFDKALAAFERAEASADLSLDELLSLLDGRVMAHVALGQKAALQATLETIAAIEPGHDLGPEVPPNVRSELERLSREAGRSPSLEVRTSAAPGGIAVEAEAANDAQGVVESVVVHARVAGGGWAEGEGRVVVPAAAGEEVQYWAEGVGPAGAPLASRGSDGDPLTTRREPATPATPNEPTDEREGGASAWPWVGIGAAVVAIAGAVAIGVAVGGGGGGNGRTQPELPVVMGF